MSDALDARIDGLHKRLDAEARAGGYQLNPDGEFTRDLVEGLIVNEDRYGYLACPCRLAAGVKEKDLDVICPCDYRDPDLNEFDACYCGLYVSGLVVAGRKMVRPIPERRPPPDERKESTSDTGSKAGAAGARPLPFPVWRCKVCGYLCARDGPPEVCPVCKAKKERFERFM
jgi:ferredoxin-thioredoxin reductase catalytic subunit